MLNFFQVVVASRLPWKKLHDMIMYPHPGGVEMKDGLKDQYRRAIILMRPIRSSAAVNV